jgi:hypothetical protein
MSKMLGDVLAMVRPLRTLLDRMSRPRWIGLLLIVLVPGLTIWASRREGPTLSPMERALVSKWGRAELDPGLSFATRARGRLTNPWLVQEFASDRTYRQWVVSGDDASHAFVQVEGRWSVVGGVIRVEPAPLGVWRPLDAARVRIATVTGLPLAPSSTVIGATHEIPFRLVGPDDLVLTFKNQNRPDWKRLSSSFNRGSDRHDRPG